ncbi:4737_t:CDS:2 [Diversispora eburnea]|uniref:4737_t:CDS:1 n=1 Tax=Diversispora eburnea TaxID=1213867 RepID=A0A9N8V0E9_9GLOM|nr:4737_t:CDS:2 [Diversispora eburnea]
MATFNNANKTFYFNQNASQGFRQIPINVPSAKQISLSMRIQEKQEEYNNLITLKKTSQEFADYFNSRSVTTESRASCRTHSNELDSDILSFEI